MILKLRIVAAVLFLGVVSAVFYPLASVLSQAGSASLSISIPQSNYGFSEQLSVELRLDTGGENVNAVSVELVYDSSLLSFNSIDSSNSAFAIAANESHGNGLVVIERGSIANINNNSAVVARVSFTTMTTPGDASFSFGSNSAVARSSDSSNILSQTYSSQIVISAPEAPSPNQPAQPIAPTTDEQPAASESQQTLATQPLQTDNIAQQDSENASQSEIIQESVRGQATNLTNKSTIEDVVDPLVEVEAKPKSATPWIIGTSLMMMLVTLFAIKYQQAIRRHRFSRSIQRKLAKLEGKTLAEIEQSVSAKKN